MPRLIDADALIAETKKNRCADCDRRKGIKRGKITFVYDFGEAPCRACDVGDMIDTLDDAPTVGGWISVKDRMPENAKHPGAFCPRYLVYTDYGITEGWYNPDKECWYGYVSFMVDSNVLNEWNIDLERGDVPKRVKNLPVKYWMPLPEPPKEEKSGNEQHMP